MKAYIKEFEYPDSKSEKHELKHRKVFVLNEDSTRIGGIDLENVTLEEIKNLEGSLREKDISDFSRKPKDPLQPKIVYPGTYKAFSKSKIRDFN